VEQRFLTVPQIAKDLSISEDLVRIWIRKKQLPAYRVGKEYRIKREDYEEFLKQRRTTDG
jgi:excisionase family DNA binding protein